MRKIVVLLAVLMLALMAMPATAEQASEWVLDQYADVPGTLGEYNGPGGDIVIPAEVDGEPVRVISTRVFNDDDTITSVVIPEGVTTIEANAFVGCDALESVTLPESLRVLGMSVFFRNDHFKNLTIPAGVQYIGDMTLDCGLERITFEGSIPIIDDHMFDYFGPDFGSKAIYVPDDLVDAYREYFHGNELIVGSGKNAEYITEPDAESDFEFDAATGTITAYNGDRSVITVPDEIDGVQVTAIGDNVFERMDNLYAVNLPESIAHIGKRAFAYDTKYVHINIPQALKSIDDEAFEAAYFFKQPVFPASLETIGAGAFRHAVNLCSWGDPALVLPEGVREIGDEAFNGAFINELELPSTLDRIGARAFADCGTTYMAFNAYELPEIAPDAFAGSTLTQLADIDLPWDATRAQWDAAKAIFDPMGFANLTVWRNNPSSGGHCFAVSFSDGATKGAYDKDGFISEYTGTEPNVSAYSYISWDSGDVNTIGVGAGVFKGNQVIRTFWPHHCNWFTTIQAEAFADSTLEYIEMYDSITTIGARAFANCTNLTEIVLPEFLTELAPDAFAGCTGITKIDVQCDASILTPGMFADCVNLTEISFARGAIPAGMMDNCATLTNIALGDGVTAIGARAFADTGISRFVIPASKDVDFTAFDGVSDLCLSADATDDQVAAWSEALNYPWYDSILREGEASKLVKMPFEPTDAECFEFEPETGTIREYLGDEIDVVIPREIDGVTVREIAYGAFDRCMDYTNTDVANNQTDWVPLRSIVLPETIEVVSDGLFSYCQQLETFICYAPLESTGKGTFTRCASLKDVVFVNGLKQIDNYCFEQTGPMNNMWFGDKLDRVGIQAFSHAGVTKLDLNAATYDSGAITACEQLTELHIGSRAEQFGDITVQDCPQLALVCLEMEHAEGKIPGAMMLARLADPITIRLPEGATEQDIRAAEYAPLFGTEPAVNVVREACAKEIAVMPDPAALREAALNRPIVAPAVEPEPAAEPTAEPAGDPVDPAPYMGAWQAISMTEDGETYDVAAFGLSIILTLEENGIVSLDMGGEADEAEWTATDRGLYVDGMDIILQADGTLFMADGAGGILFERGAADGSESAAIAEPADVQIASADDRIGVRYVCTEAEFEGGVRLDASMLGQEYSLQFNADGTVKFVMAGAEVPNGTWEQRTVETEDGEAEAFVINYYGNVEVIAVMTDTGFDMNYMDAMRLFFEPEQL